MLSHCAGMHDCPYCICISSLTIIALDHVSLLMHNFVPPLLLHDAQYAHVIIIACMFNSCLQEDFHLFVSFWTCGNGAEYSAWKAAAHSLDDHSSVDVMLAHYKVPCKVLNNHSSETCESCLIKCSHPSNLHRWS